MSAGKIKKILVPFDGSKFSKKAAKNAIRIAEKFDATLANDVALDWEAPICGAMHL